MNEIDALAAATATLIAEQRDVTARATAMLLAEQRDALKAEIEAKAGGIAAVAAAGVASAAALVAPAAAAAEARRAALQRRRADTLAIVAGWLDRCADDADHHSSGECE